MDHRIGKPRTPLTPQLPAIPKPVAKPVTPRKAVITRAKPCEHRGRIPLSRMDNGIETNCSNCWTYPCELHHKCTHGKPALGITCCQSCPDYKAESEDLP